MMDEKRLARLEHAADRIEIQECLTRFSRGMDRSDREIYSSAFHDDAVIAAGPWVGSAQGCWDWAVPMHEAGQILTHHSLLNNTVEINGDTAHSECYYLFIARNYDESLWMAGGRYIDRIERRHGEWKIALRINIVEWGCVPPPMPVPFADIPGIEKNGLSSRSKDDPSYRRPLTNMRDPMTP